MSGDSSGGWKIHEGSDAPFVLKVAGGGGGKGMHHHASLAIA